MLAIGNILVARSISTLNVSNCTHLDYVLTHYTTLKGKTSLILPCNHPKHCSALPSVASPKPAPHYWVLPSLSLQPFVLSFPLQPTPALPPGSRQFKREKTRVPTPTNPADVSVSPEKQWSSTGQPRTARVRFPLSAQHSILCWETRSNKVRDNSLVWTDSGPQ